jgi:hypothetical protein
MGQSEHLMGRSKQWNRVRDETEQAMDGTERAMDGME